MAKHKEGDLYATIDVYRKRFVIYYGYYEDFERNSIYNDPVPIYPDLAKNPEYDSEGHPIVTQMQVACDHYKGKADDGQCGLCTHFEKGKMLFGLCKCPKLKRNK
jgi:hypothetical protein